MSNITKYDKNKFIYDGVCLSGGGIRGLLQLGVLHEKYEHEEYDPKFCKEYAGISIGSVFCLLLVCGYTPIEIFTEIYKMDNFFTVSDFHNVWDVIKHMGFIDINSFIKKVDFFVKKKMGKSPTFEELWLKTNKTKTLYIGAVNVSKLREEKFCYTTHPNMKCIEAVKLSCNLPIIFQRQLHNNDFMVDGGLLNNFPWEYLSQNLKNVLGIVIVPNKCLDVNNENIKKDTSTINYFHRILTLPMGRMTDLYCRLAPSNIDIYRVSWNGNGLLKFKMSSETKMNMFLRGYKMTEYQRKIVRLNIDEW